MIGRQNIMLRKLLQAKRASARPFSTSVATTGDVQAAPTGIQTLWQYSDAALAKNAAKEQSE